MSDQDFEQRFARMLRDDAEQGVRPVDAGAIAHVATGKGSTPGNRGRWTRGTRYLLAAALIVVGVAAAFGLGSRLLVEPTSTATPGPTATAVAQSPAASVTPTAPAGPSATPTLLPTSTPTLLPSLSPTPTVQPTASASPSPSSTPVAVPTANPIGWVELSGFPGYGKQTHVTGIAYGSGRFVAVGWSFRNGTTHGRVWSSVDGLAWKAEADSAFTGLSLEAVTFNGSQFFAFASPAPATVWKSSDGSVWQKVDVPFIEGDELCSDCTVFDGSHVADVTTVGTTMFAAGEATVTNIDLVCNETCVTAWRSTNGTDWEQSTVVDGDSFLTSAAMPGLSVVVTYGSYIGKGIWSADFDDWAPVPGIPESDGFLDAASDGQRIVLVGYGPTADDDYGAAVAIATNGSSWDVVSIDEASGPAEQLTWAAGKFVAVGTGPGVIVTWWSTDGQTWTRGPDVGPALSLNLGPTPGDDPFNHRTIGAGGPGVVLTQTGTDRLHVWFAPMSAFGG